MKMNKNAAHGLNALKYQFLIGEIKLCKISVTFGGHFFFLLVGRPISEIKKLEGE